MVSVSVFQLEDVEVLVADHVQRVMKPNFGASWEEVGVDNELEDTYALSTMSSLEGRSWALLLHLYSGVGLVISDYKT